MVVPIRSIYGFIGIVIAIMVLFAFFSLSYKNGEGEIHGGPLVDLSSIIPSLCQTFSKNHSSSSVIGQNDWTKNLKPSEATSQQMIDYFNWSNRSSCGLAHDFGGQMMNNPSGLDGQKAVCLDPKVAPQPGNCIVYSFGINNEWSFDDLMEKYGCEVFAFDPSMNVENHNRSKMIHFFKMGLDDHDHIDSDNNWKLRSLKTIYKDLGHEGKIIDYLKIDIEGGEWKVLAEMIKTGMMSKVRQLAVEFHLSSSNSMEEFRSAVALLKSMEDSGLVRFDSKYNPWFKMEIPSLNYNGPVGFEIAWYQVLHF